MCNSKIWEIATINTAEYKKVRRVLFFCCYRITFIPHEISCYTLWSQLLPKSQYYPTRTIQQKVMNNQLVQITLIPNHHRAKTSANSGLTKNAVGERSKTNVPHNSYLNYSKTGSIIAIHVNACLLLRNIHVVHNNICGTWPLHSPNSSLLLGKPEQIPMHQYYRRVHVCAFIMYSSCTHIIR